MVLAPATKEKLLQTLIMQNASAVFHFQLTILQGHCSIPRDIIFFVILVQSTCTPSGQAAPTSRATSSPACLNEEDTTPTQAQTAGSSTHSKCLYLSVQKLFSLMAYFSPSNHSLDSYFGKILMWTQICTIWNIFVGIRININNNLYIFAQSPNRFSNCHVMIWQM